MPPKVSPVRLPALPTGLASTYEVLPVTEADASDIFALVCDCDIAVLGYPDWDPEDVEAEIAPTSTGPRDQALVRRRGDGRLVSWWWTGPKPGTSQYVTDVYVDPALDAGQGDLLSLAGWDAIEGWARQWARAGHVAGAYLDVGSLQGDAATERRLEEAGFDRVRTFWRMIGDVPEQPRPAPEVPGLLIRVAEDHRLLHRLRDEIFADHWDDHPMAYEDWVDRLQRAPGYDPSLWWLATIDGDPAGLQLASRQMAGESTLYVMTLGTRAAYRGRGVAAALLHHAFETARRESYAKVSLGVDSDSPTNAPSVYRRAGFDVQFAMDAWHKPLR